MAIIIFAFSVVGSVSADSSNSANIDKDAEGENREVGVSLPSYAKNDLGEYVSLELEADRPFLFNEEYNKKYSSKQLNSKKKANECLYKTLDSAVSTLI